MIYSLPFEKGFRMCRQYDFGTSAEIDNDNSFFVIRPFSNQEKSLFIKAEVDQEIDVSQISISEWNKAPISESTSKEIYTELVSKAIDRASDMNGKIVLSRIDEAPSASLNISESLLLLRSKFRNSFVYFLATEQHGIWLGATPETLIEKEGELMSTMALAGTKWGGDLFTQKEFDEQMMVTKDIMERLSDEVIEVGDVYEMSYGELRHLRTNIRWQSEDSVLKFAELLHPTPAVSGYPRNEALRFIQANESHNRMLYAGYLGTLNPENKSQLFVNLRCMRLFSDQIRVHVGGGINAQSDPNSEWEETVRKSNSVKEGIVNE